MNNFLKKCNYFINLRIRSVESLHDIKIMEHELEQDCNMAILLGTPEYYNLGDHLIAFAILKFWNEYFPDKPIVEITREICEKYTDKITGFLSRSENRLIIITGGGFLGDLWPEMDNLIKLLIDNSLTKKILIFPQTVFFYSNSNSVEEFRSTYASTSNLFLYVRDVNSQNNIKHLKLLERNQSALAPDMTFYLYPFETQPYERREILFCFRRDKESTISKIYEENLAKTIYTLSNENIIRKDTVDKYRLIKPKDRAKKLMMFADFIAEKKLVITNRLHCMIYCFLTKTPCIAIDNISKKISGVFCWIQECNYILCVDEHTLTKEMIKNMLECVPQAFDKTQLSNHYEQMAKKIRKHYDKEIS